MDALLDTVALDANVRADLSRLAGQVLAARQIVTAMSNEALTDWLYTNWYTAPRQPFNDGALSNRSDLSQALRAALEAPQRWQRGWVALQVEPGQRCLAGLGELRRWAEPGDWANLARPGAPAMPGDGLALFDLLTWVDAPTGFVGVRPQRAEPAGAMVRLYWSVAAVQVGHVLRELVAMLDQLGPAWSIKCPGQALDYGRVDSLVVYLERPHWPAFEPHTVALAQRMSPRLRDAVPPLTRRLARGLGFAQDAGTQHSFGQGRCAALADGARRVACDPGIDLPQALQCLVQSLHSHAIDPLRPWLSPNHEAELSVPVSGK